MFDQLGRVADEPGPASVSVEAAMGLFSFLLWVIVGVVAAIWDSITKYLLRRRRD